MRRRMVELEEKVAKSARLESAIRGALAGVQYGG